MTALSSSAAHTHQPGCCKLLATGSDERNIRFCPSLFQLFVERGKEQERVELGYAGTRLLERLLQNPGEVVGREELMSYAWPDRVVGQGSLNQQIYSLRQLFCDDKGREVIQTLPRRGYQFNPNYVLEQHAEAPPEEQDDPPPTPAPDEAPVKAVQPKARSRWSDLASFACALVLGLALSTWINGRDESPHQRTVVQHEVTLQLMADSSAELDRLERLGSALAARLTSLGHGQLVATLDSYGGYVRLFCHQSAQLTGWLVFHPSQFTDLADTQLRQCLS